jgi:4-amino-4-deoxy-L-arabinose transferase-like glycosyltransferase
LQYKPSIERTALAILLGLLIALLVVVTTLPAFPVDETRYLTVAWEMRASGNWALPTLNFEPYSHKPPLLFWLINLLWSLLGEQVWVARLVGVLSFIAVLILAHRLEGDLAATETAEDERPATSVLLLAGFPVFIAFGFSIMFDMLLTACVVAALLALWHAGRYGDRRAWAAFAISMGAGLLAKGPVALLTLLPVALLGPLWIAPEQRPRWYLKVAAAVAIGGTMVLGWALRAAYLGGPEYAEMIFWKQSAGRISSSFAHARPFWFYIPILTIFLLPVILWRPLRDGVRKVAAASSPARNFLLAWIIPPFIGLSLISGKQPHYLLPLIPGIAILVALGMRKTEFRPRDRTELIAVAGVSATMVVVLSIVGTSLLPQEGILEAVQHLSLPWAILIAVDIFAAIYLLARSIRGALIGIAIANVIAMMSALAIGRSTIAKLYDLQPMADVLATHAGSPIAAAQKTRGEFGFLARLQSPLIIVPEENIACWLAKTPRSLAIMRTQVDADVPAYRTVYRQPYRANDALLIIESDGKTACTNGDAVPITKGTAEE